MTENFKGGLILPSGLRILGPWVALTPTSSHLEFQMRFRWLRHLFGPWGMDREVVREVYLNSGGALDPWFRVGFLGEENLPWSFLTQKPYDVLRRMEQLGYPVRTDDLK